MMMSLQPEPVMQALRQILEEIATMLPKLLVAALAAAVLIILTKVINWFLSKLLQFGNFDDLLERYVGWKPPISTTKIIIGLTDFGIWMVYLYGLLHLLGAYEVIGILNAVLMFVGKVASVLLIVTFVVVAYDRMMKRAKLESKLSAFMSFLILLLATVLLVDIASLSPDVRSALATGLSIGIGISIGVFTAWFFFGDYIEALVKEKTRGRPQAGEFSSREEERDRR